MPTPTPTPMPMSTLTPAIYPYFPILYFFRFNKHYANKNAFSSSFV